VQKKVAILDPINGIGKIVSGTLEDFQDALPFKASAELIGRLEQLLFSDYPRVLVLSSSSVVLVSMASEITVVDDT
jgi:hypothetical protein